MFILAKKLKTLKAELKSWNMNTFGNVHQKVNEAQAYLDSIQDQISSFGYNEELQELELKAHSELDQAMHFQEEFWREKANLEWFVHGDRNTSFFHRVAKVRYSSKKLSLLRHGDLILDNQSDIEAHVLVYYTSLYSSHNACFNNGLIDRVVSNLVTMEDNVFLTNLPSMEKVRSTVFSMNASGAPGPDSFGGMFYQKFWEVIKEDVHRSVMQFFADSWLLPNLNSNLVVLIPKFKGADKIEDFRPIVLANYQFKIISKVLPDRLTTIAPKTVSSQQRGSGYTYT